MTDKIDKVKRYRGPPLNCKGRVLREMGRIYRLVLQGKMALEPYKVLTAGLAEMRRGFEENEAKELIERLDRIEANATRANVIPLRRNG
jgi:hypothetical protein